MVKVASWRGHSSPPRAHRTAYEGSGLPSALMRRGPQYLRLLREAMAFPSEAAQVVIFAAFDYFVQALRGLCSSTVDRCCVLLAAMSEEALDGRGAASLLPRYDAPSEHVPAALRKRRVHVPHLGQGATSIVKSVLPWWRLSWQPSAHKIASEGLRLLSALGRRGLTRQNECPWPWSQRVPKLTCSLRDHCRRDQHDGRFPLAARPPRRRAQVAPRGRAAEVSARYTRL